MTSSDFSADTHGTRTIAMLIFGFLLAAGTFLMSGLLLSSPDRTSEWAEYVPTPLLVGVYDSELDAVVRRVDNDGVPLVPGPAVDLAFERCGPGAEGAPRQQVESRRTWVVDHEGGQETFPEPVRTVPFSSGCMNYSIDVLVLPQAVDYASLFDDATITVRFNLQPVDTDRFLPLVVESEPFRMTNAPGTRQTIPLKEQPNE